MTPLNGLVLFGGGNYGKVFFSVGCSDTACQQNDLIPSATSTASQTDAAVIIVGLTQEQESEANDRTSLLLPGHQQDLITAVAGAANGRPIVLVIMSAGPLDISFAKNDNRIQSILWVGYPGQSGGQAIAEVIFGNHNPGKGPFTISRQFAKASTVQYSPTSKKIEGPKEVQRNQTIIQGC